jgi:hypothetical protein
MSDDHEILGTTPHKISMISGLPEEEHERENQRAEKLVSSWKTSIIESAMLQQDLVSGQGRALLTAIMEIKAGRLYELAAADPLCIAIDRALSMIGEKINVIPAHLERQLSRLVGPEYAIPFAAEAARRAADTSQQDNPSTGP